MAQISCEADMHCAAGTIFGLIADLRGQEQWLSTSAAFRGTTGISPGPVGMGSSYTEDSPFGVRHGRVTEYDPPTAITFHQPMTMRLRGGTVDVVMRYTLAPVSPAEPPAAPVTRVCRVVTVTIGWPLKAFQPFVLQVFRTESQRTLLALKAHADTLN